MIELLSLGAGVQSSTLLLMSCVGQLPKLDHAIFADTQWEPKAVYDWLVFLKNAAGSAGIPIATVTVGNIRQDIVEFWAQRKSADGKRHASIPAFIKNPDGSKGLVRRQCTSTYKIEVIEKYIRTHILSLKPKERWPKETVIRQWLGISADETQRMRRSLRPAIKFWYPLVEECKSNSANELFAKGFTRNDCLKWMSDNGFPHPPRSACIGCPFHSDTEWFLMKHNAPEEFEDACLLDEEIRTKEHDRQRIQRPGELIGSPYLHKSLTPLRMVEFNPVSELSEGRAMASECSGMCGV